MPRKKKKPQLMNPVGWLLHVARAVLSMKTHAQDAVVGAWNELEQERRREIIAVGLIALALISLLALLSYSPSDLAVTSGLEQSIRNWIGWPGAWLAGAIIFVFGAAGYALPALLLFWAIDRYRSGDDSPIRKLRIIGFTLLLIAISSIMGRITLWVNPDISDEQLWRVCGALGYTLNNRLDQLGALGGLIVNFSLLAVTLLLSTPFLFTAFFDRAANLMFPVKDPSIEPLESDYEEEDEDAWSAARAEARSSLSLRPFREESHAGAREPTISSHMDNWDDSDDGLPPLATDEPIEGFEEPVDSGEGPVIVTKEDEEPVEVDLGVNLVETPDNSDYQLPPITLMEKPDNSRPEVQRDEILHNSRMLEQTLQDFNISAKVVEVNYGPTITCYELEPAPGIKISRIENLQNDITRALKAEMVRIVAPIPGKGTVGVEVPNRTPSGVLLREVIGHESFQSMDSKLRVALGKTISGEAFTFDLIKAPHLLVAGATGSGKSVCINTIITSILYNAAPHEVKLLLIDPKQVELALYKDIPHLLSPVVTDPKRAGAALRWAVEEMETRYRYLKKCGVRNIKEYNKKRMSQQKGDVAETESSQMLPGFLPYVVILIDELADLMMVVRQDVEGAIARLAAMARAVGIHLVLATQRPSVDVLTGVIKNNFPSRMAFQVSSTNDSRTILDMKGAESLMGRGDMLFSIGGAGKPIRLQCCYISTEEVEDICDFVKEQQEVDYVQEEFTPIEDSASVAGGGATDEEDDLYSDAVTVVLENDAASTSLLQRRLKIGYGRAARLLDLMEENGIVGPPRGSKPRQVILNQS